MDVFLKQSGNRIVLYFNNEIITVFENKTIEDVAGWVKQNFTNTKIHIEME